MEDIPDQMIGVIIKHLLPPKGKTENQQTGLQKTRTEGPRLPMSGKEHLRSKTEVVTVI
jgi:hypothetical protein